MPACATQAVWRRARARGEVTAVAVAVRTALPDDVRIDWRAVIADRPDETGTLVVDPGLVDCPAVAVLVAQRSGPPEVIGVSETTFAVDNLTTPRPIEALWVPGVDSACAVLLIFRRTADPNEIGVHVARQAHASTLVDVIAAARQPQWLALLPPAAIADIGAVVLVLPAVICLQAPGACTSWLPGYQSNGGTSRNATSP